MSVRKSDGGLQSVVMAQWLSTRSGAALGTSSKPQGIVIKMKFHLGLR
jgi:hypothetical protein